VLPPRRAPAGPSPPGTPQKYRLDQACPRHGDAARSQPGDLALLVVLRLYEKAIQPVCAELVVTACRDGEVHAARPVLISSNSAPARDSSGWWEFMPVVEHGAEVPVRAACCPVRG
jgi:hypothetical protein